MKYVYVVVSEMMQYHWGILSNKNLKYFINDKVRNIVENVFPFLIFYLPLSYRSSKAS